MVSILAVSQTAQFSKTDSVSPIVEALSYLGAVLLVLFLAYISTKYLLRFSLGKVKSNKIRLIDRFFVDNSKSLLLFKVEKNVYLISSDKNGLQMLDKLGEVELEEETNEEHVLSFKEKLQRKRKDNLCEKK